MGEKPSREAFELGKKACRDGTHRGQGAGHLSAALSGRSSEGGFVEWVVSTNDTTA